MTFCDYPPFWLHISILCIVLLPHGLTQAVKGCFYSLEKKNILVNARIFLKLCLWYEISQQTLHFFFKGFYGIYSGALSMYCWASDNQRILLSTPQRSRKVGGCQQKVPRVRKRGLTTGLYMCSHPALPCGKAKQKEVIRKRNVCDEEQLVYSRCLNVYILT